MRGRCRLSVADQCKLLRAYQGLLALSKAFPSPFAVLLEAQLREKIRAVRWQDYPAMVRLGIYDPNQHRGTV